MEFVSNDRGGTDSPDAAFSGARKIQEPCRPDPRSPPLPPRPTAGRAGDQCRAARTRSGAAFEGFPDVCAPFAEESGGDGGGTGAAGRAACRVAVSAPGDVGRPPVLRPLERNIGADRTAAVQNVRHAARRNAERARQPAGAQAPGIGSALQQPAGMRNREHGIHPLRESTIPASQASPAARNSARRLRPPNSQDVKVAGFKG